MSVILYPCMFCVALSMDLLFVFCVLTVFVNCLKQFVICLCVFVVECDGVVCGWGCSIV